MSQYLAQVLQDAGNLNTKSVPHANGGKGYGVKHDLFCLHIKFHHFLFATELTGLTSFLKVRVFFSTFNKQCNSLLRSTEETKGVYFLDTKLKKYFY